MFKIISVICVLIFSFWNGFSQNQLLKSWYGNQFFHIEIKSKTILWEYTDYNYNIDTNSNIITIYDFKYGYEIFNQFHFQIKNLNDDTLILKPINNSVKYPVLYDSSSLYLYDYNIIYSDTLHFQKIIFTKSTMGITHYLEIDSTGKLFLKVISSSYYLFYDEKYIDKISRQLLYFELNDLIDLIKSSRFESFPSTPHQEIDMYCEIVFYYNNTSKAIYGCEIPTIFDPLMQFLNDYSNIK